MACVPTAVCAMGSRETGSVGCCSSQTWQEMRGKCVPDAMHDFVRQKHLKILETTYHTYAI